MSSKKLILMVGFPRSGKTTAARGLGHPIVNPDSIRLALHGMPYIQRAEPFVWAIAKLMTRSLFEAGHDEVIIDACNNTRKRREEWKSWDGEWQREYAVIPTTAEECTMRLAEMEYKDEIDREDAGRLREAINRMERAHEPVEADEWDA